MLRSLVSRIRPLSGAALLLLPLLAAGPLAAQTPLVLGLSYGRALVRDVEFQQYDRVIPVYKQNGIQASLFEYSVLQNPGNTEESIYQSLKGYQVVRLHTPNEGIYRVTPEMEAHAKIAGAALLRYVQDGGGLLLQPEPVRYANSEDEKYWNLVLAPLGLQILHEGIYDPTRNFEAGAVGRIRFWITRNVTPHPVTAEVKTLCLPQTFMSMPGVAAMQYSPEWQVVVRGEKEAASYTTGPDNNARFETPGSYPQAPPVLAVRELGKGRVACLPVATIYTGANYLNPVWENTFETAGDRVNGTPSDGLKLVMNLYHWLGSPAAADPTFGTHKIPPYQPAQYPPTVNWDTTNFSAVPTSEVRGVFGLHSAYSDGKGTVAQYAASAQAAGLGFIVFSDPLEKLTEQKLAALKADCAAASSAGAFYACPGIEFTDGIGNRWLLWGEKIAWPEATFKDKIWTYTQWDGQRIHFYGEYMAQCGYPGSTLLDYKQLRANGAHAENLWWFYHCVPYAYDQGKLVADNTPDYLFAQRDLRMLAPVSFTRVLSPDQIAPAAQLCWTAFRNLAQAQENLNTRCSQPFWAANVSGQYLSQGPQILAWDVMNNQMENNYLITRGSQRVRARFAVHSDAGIATVIVHDSDLGALRRYGGAGAKDLQRDFEIVQDKQHNLVLEVIDTQGRHAWSTMMRVYNYKQGLYRCGDNLNILGSCSMCWIPDRNGMVSMGRYFNNGAQYSLEGADSAGPVCPTPQSWGEEQVHLQGVGDYPANETVSKLMDVTLGSSNLQIVSERMQFRSETWDNPNRPGPAISTVPKDLGPLEYFERTHTLYSPADRVDFYTMWNFARPREGTRDYQGALNWHEGEITFKKDCVLTGAVPIPLVQMRCPVDLQRQWGTLLLATEPESTRVLWYRDALKPPSARGRLRAGGYLANMTTLLGYEAFLAPEGSDYAYEAGLNEGNMGGRVIIGLGREGQVVKAGTVMKYRFAFGEFADPVAGSAKLEDTVRAFNLGGGQAGYPVAMKVGAAADALFFFTAQAAGNEAVFTLGPRATMIDLPIRVRGLQDNGCAAVFSTKRPWLRFVSVVGDTAYFQEPIEKANEMWVGNVFVCDNPAVKLTLIVDGQTPGAKPRLEVHNPTDKALTVTVRSPQHTPTFGGITAPVTLPAGDSVRLVVEGQTLVPAGG
jgi:hypothetical protein